jgi:hypothetical protein
MKAEVFAYCTSPQRVFVGECRRSPRTRFYGKDATRQAEASLLSGKQLKTAVQGELKQGANPYIGDRLTDVFFDPAYDYIEQKKQILSTLNRISQCLCLFDVALYKLAGFDNELKLPLMTLQLGVKKAQLQYIGSGNFGAVFKLSLGNHHFAFKTFFKRHEELLHSGPYSEAALGAFITAKNVCNMPHLLVANPQAEWQLSEFIDSEYVDESRKGPTWQDLGFRVLDPLINLDNERQSKSLTPYRIDYGHMTTVDRNAGSEKIHPDVEVVFSNLDETGFVPIEAYWGLFSTIPETREQLFRNLGCLHPKNRLWVIKRALDYPEVKDFPTQSFFETHILEEKDVLPLFKILLRHPDPSVRAKAIFNPKSWSEKRKRNIFQKIWETQTEFTPFLIYLGQLDRLPHFLRQVGVATVKPIDR